VPVFVPDMPVDEAAWLRPDAGRGGGGARVVWTGSRAADVNADITGLQLERLSPGGAHGQARSEADAYGEAKAVVDAAVRPMRDYLRGGAGLLGKGGGALGRCGGVMVAVVCPGFVATDLTPWFMRAAVPFLDVIRPVVCGQQLTPRRGIAPHLAAALADPGVLDTDGKLITHRGMLTRAVNGWREHTSKDDDGTTRLLRQWLLRWSLDDAR